MGRSRCFPKVLAFSPGQRSGAIWGSGNNLTGFSNPQEFQNLGPSCLPGKPTNDWSCDMVSLSSYPVARGSQATEVGTARNTKNQYIGLRNVGGFVHWSQARQIFSETWMLYQMNNRFLYASARDLYVGKVPCWQTYVWAFLLLAPWLHQAGLGWWGTPRLDMGLQDQKFGCRQKVGGENHWKTTSILSFLEGTDSIWTLQVSLLAWLNLLSRPRRWTFLQLHKSLLNRISVLIDAIP